MVEDLHAAYWEEYEGGYKKPGTFIEYCKGLVDELNADHARGAIAPTEFTAITLSMHLYDSVAVFERGAHTKKWAPKIGNADSVPDRAMQKQLTEAVSARDEAQATLKKTQASLAVAEDTLARMHSSLSWKVTAPIRLFMAALGSGPRRNR